MALRSVLPHRVYGRLCIVAAAAEAMAAVNSADQRPVCQRKVRCTRFAALLIAFFHRLYYIRTFCSANRLLMRLIRKKSHRWRAEAKKNIE